MHTNISLLKVFLIVDFGVEKGIYMFFGLFSSFPGGMVSAVDSSLLDAALRETEEELGINMQDVNVWGFSADYPEQVGIVVVLLQKSLLC